MEERMIDDEYGRGIRLKKTADGYVDVTDELAKETDEETPENENAEEMAFEFPMLDTDEDDEDLVGLSPEEALKLRQQKAEAAKLRRAEYEEVCQAGEKYLESGDFQNAEKEFEKALMLDRTATEASVGYWRAKTGNFENPDALVGEYADASIESLEYDLGVDAVEQIKKEYKEQLQKRYDELTEEEKPLAERVLSAQERRRGLLSTRVRNRTLAFVLIALPMIVAMVFTGIFVMRIFTPDGERYTTLSIILGSVSFVLFLAFIVATNKCVNAYRMKSANERLEETEEGEKLVKIRDYLTIYKCLLDVE